MLAGPPKSLLVALAVLQAAVLAAAQSGAGTLTPAGCVCPDECDCDVLHGTINCAGRNLQAIPTNINSCSWPGIIKMQVYIYTVQYSTARYTGVQAIDASMCICTYMYIAPGFAHAQWQTSSTLFSLQRFERERDTARAGICFL